MISRRGFFGVLVDAAVAVSVAPTPHKPWTVVYSELEPIHTSPLTFKGVPIVFNDDAPNNRTFFFDSKKGPMLVTLT